MALPAPAPDRTAVVTGASSGIGAAIARDLAGRGWGCTLVARSADKLTELAAELRGSGVRAEVLPADLLVNNAGLSTLGRVAEADPEREMAMIELDVVAVVDLTVRFLPGMVVRARGGILNVASTAAFQPLPGQAGYGGCKAFVLSYTRSLGGELKGTGVHATALCPGPVDTGFGEAAGFDKDEAEASLPSFMWESPEAVAKTGLDALAANHPVAIPGTANRIGATFANLAPKRLLVPLLASRHPALK